MAGNSNLQMSRAGKTDEFYTQLSLVENEMKHYTRYFEGKTVFCNCDDPEYSNFWLFFQLNFYRLGLKKLVSTHYEEDKPSYKMEIVSTNTPQGQIGIRAFTPAVMLMYGKVSQENYVELTAASAIPNKEIKSPQILRY